MKDTADRLNHPRDCEVLHVIKSGFLVVGSPYFYLQNWLFVNEIPVWAAASGFVATAFRVVLSI
jgi:hypothetical protein